MRGFLSVVLVAAMLLGITVYGETTSGPLVPYQEPVTITWGANIHMAQVFDPGDSYEDNIWTRTIKEHLNIDIEVAFTADEASGAFQNKLMTLLASDDLPDITRSSNRTFFHQAQRAGYLADLTDLMTEFGSEQLLAFQSMYPAGFMGGTVDGRLYGFPNLDDKFHTGAYLWVRDDWLENTGSEAPKNMDEMVELARKFTTGDPNQDGQNNTYGLVFVRNMMENLYGILGGFGVPAMNDGIFYRGDDGKVTYSYIQPQVKEALAVVRGMYSEGLIDPEFIVKDWDSIEADIAAGKLGMQYYRNWGTWYPWNILWENLGKTTRPYPIPVQDGYQKQVGIANSEGGELCIMSSKCENPEALVQIANLFTKLVYEDPDPNGFETYWPNGRLYLCPVYVFMPPELYSPMILDALAKGTDEGMPGYAKPQYRRVVEFNSGADTGMDAYGSWGQMSEWGSMAIALFDYRRDNDALVENVLGSNIPEKWLESNAVLTDIINIGFTDIVIGNRDLDDFDTIAKDWLNNGGQEVLDELEILYPAQ